MTTHIVIIDAYYMYLKKLYMQECHDDNSDIMCMVHSVISCNDIKLKLTNNSKLHGVYKRVLAQFRYNNKDKCLLDACTVDPSNNCFQFQQTHHFAPDLYNNMH